MEHINPNHTPENPLLDKLKQLVPEAFADGKLNIETLQTLLADATEDDEERRESFGLNWTGKAQARRMAFMPVKDAALKPVPGAGVNEATTDNVFIEGENLGVLKLLREAYADKIKMIYIDPPYNTGNDFIYKDDFSETVDTYLKRSGQREGDTLLVANPKSQGRYHSNWLNFMYPRLRVARDLLCEDGVIFVSIDDNEVHNLRQVMNEIFGEENLIEHIIWKKRYGGGAKEKYIVNLHEHIIMYCKSKEHLDPIFMSNDKDFVEKYYTKKDDKFEKRGPYRTQPLEAAKSMGERKNLMYEIEGPAGVLIKPKRQWLWSKERAYKAQKNNDLEFNQDKDANWTVNIKQYLYDENGTERTGKVTSIIDNIYTQHGTKEIENIFGVVDYFPYPKPSSLIKLLIKIGSSNGDFIVDFFAGSGTTAQAVIELNKEEESDRKFILIQLDEKIKPDTEPYRNGYKFISQVTVERIKRVAAKHESAGFRVFKYEKSSFRPWQNVQGINAGQLQMAFAQATDQPLVSHWKKEDLLTEVLLLEGFPLHSRVTPYAAITTNAVQQISSDFTEHALYVCLDEEIDPETVDNLHLGKDDVFICLDNALTDVLKLRLDDKLKLKTI